MKIFFSTTLLLAFLGSVLAKNDDESFDAYIQEFGKQYASQEERLYRQEIFKANLQTIQEHNANPTAFYKMEINVFCDRLAEELPMGYDKSMHASYQVGSFKLSVSKSKIPFSDILQDPPLLFPKAIDWRTKQVTTPVKNQGGCGSCWAFAATAALESHIAIQTSHTMELSMQELVSCVPNARECGGGGGCMGSTAELAYDFVAHYGMVDEWRFSYQSFHGEHVNCSIMKDTNDDDEKVLIRQERNLRLGATVPDTSSDIIPGAVASIVGFANVPTNHYEALMQAVTVLGPVVVNVAATGWGLYQGGIYDDDKKATRDINHAVVLEGYGTDAETGQDYWLIRNSWGSMWGEDGYIRLKRVDPKTLDDPETDCRMDTTPADGTACTKDDDGKDIIPPPVKVCGTSGVLFDGVVPVGGHIIKN